MTIREPALANQLRGFVALISETYTEPRVVFGGCFAASILAARARELLGVPSVNIQYGDIDCYVRRTKSPQLWFDGYADRAVTNLPRGVQVILRNPAYSALDGPLRQMVNARPVETPNMWDTLYLYKHEDALTWATDMATRAAAHLDLYDLAFCQVGLWLDETDPNLVNIIFSEEFLQSLVTKRLLPTKRHIGLMTELLISEPAAASKKTIAKLYKHLGITSARLMKYWDRTSFTVPEEFFEKTRMVLEAIRDNKYMLIDDLPEGTTDAYGLMVRGLPPALYERFNVSRESK